MWRLEARQFQIQICRHFNVTLIVVLTLEKQIQNIGSIERKPERVMEKQRWPELIALCLLELE